MKLYYHPASTTSRIVMMFAAEEGIDLDYQIIDLMTGEHLKPEYKALNPNCLVPMLDDDGFRARVDEAMEWFYSNYYKDHGYGLVYPQVFPHHKRPSDEAHVGAIEWGKQKAQHWLGILDKYLIGLSRKYLCGDVITLADYVGAEMVALGELVQCKYEDYPNVCRWIDNMKALKHWAKVHEVADGFTASLKDRQFVSI